MRDGKRIGYDHADVVSSGYAGMTDVQNPMSYRKESVAVGHQSPKNGFFLL
jgi:hypothetical protein